MANIFKAKTLVAKTGTFSDSISAPNIVYNTGDQTISGNKTFREAIIIDSISGNNLQLSGNSILLRSNDAYYPGGITLQPGSGIGSPYHAAVALAGKELSINSQRVQNYRVTLWKTGINNYNILTSDNLIDIYTDTNIRNNLNVVGTGSFNGLNLENINTLTLSGMNINITGNSVLNIFNEVKISGNPVLTGIPDANWASQVEINSLSGSVVFLTGNQTINGLKTFTSGIDIYSGTSPQSIRVFNTTGTNSGEFALIGWQNNQLIIGAQQSQSGILRDVIITGNNININGSGAFNIFDNTNINGNLNATGNIHVIGQFSFQNGAYASSTDGVGNFIDLRNDNYYQLNFVNTGINGAGDWHVGNYIPHGMFSWYNTNLGRTMFDLKDGTQENHDLGVYFYDKVSINAGSPLAKLHVKDTSNDVNNPITIIESDGSQAPYTFRLDTGSGPVDIAYVKGDNAGNLAFGAQNFIAFEAGGFGESSERMRINTDGKVGIGTNSPSEKLEVNGNVKFGSVGGGSPTLYMYDGANAYYNRIFWGEKELTFADDPNGENKVFGILYNDNVNGELTLYSNLGVNGTRLIFPSGKQGYIAIDSEIVHKTGNEIISGVKTFIGNHIISGNTTVSGSINISGNYDIYSQIENAKKLAIAYAIAL